MSAPIPAPMAAANPTFLTTSPAEQESCPQALIAAKDMRLPINPAPMIAPSAVRPFRPRITSSLVMTSIGRRPRSRNSVSRVHETTVAICVASGLVPTQRVLGGHGSRYVTRTRSPTLTGVRSCAVTRVSGATARTATRNVTGRVSTSCKCPVQLADASSSPRQARGPLTPRRSPCAHGTDRGTATRSVHPQRACNPMGYNDFRCDCPGVVPVPPCFVNVRANGRGTHDAPV